MLLRQDLHEKTTQRDEFDHLVSLLRNKNLRLDELKSFFEGNNQQDLIQTLKKDLLQANEIVDLLKHQSDNSSREATTQGDMNKLLQTSMSSIEKELASLKIKLDLSQRKFKEFEKANNVMGGIYKSGPFSGGEQMSEV